MQVGIAGAAAVICDAQGEVAGTICITGPTARLREGRRQEIEARCISAGQAISRQLGHTG